jgi:hypothetical protein
MPQPTEGAPNVPAACQGSQRHGSVLSARTCDREEKAAFWKRANRHVRPSPNRGSGAMAGPPTRDQTAATADGERWTAPSTSRAMGRTHAPSRSPNGLIGGMAGPVSVTKPEYRRPRTVGNRIKRRAVRPQTAVSVGADKEKMRGRIANGVTILPATEKLFRPPGVCRSRVLIQAGIGAKASYALFEATNKARRNELFQRALRYVGATGFEPATS